MRHEDLSFYRDQRTARSYLRKALSALGVVQSMQYRFDEMDEISLNQIEGACKEVVSTVEAIRQKQKDGALEDLLS